MKIKWVVLFTLLFACKKQEEVTPSPVIHDYTWTIIPTGQPTDSFSFQFYADIVKTNDPRLYFDTTTWMNQYHLLPYTDREGRVTLQGWYFRGHVSDGPITFQTNSNSIYSLYYRGGRISHIKPEASIVDSVRAVY